MPSRRKIDVATVRARINTECPACHEKIAPNELKHEAETWRNTRCPKCGHVFELHKAGPTAYRTS